MTTKTDLASALARPSPTPQITSACFTSASPPQQTPTASSMSPTAPFDSPVGTLLLAATDIGLVRFAYAREDHDAVLQKLADRISPRILHAPARLDPSPRSSTSTSQDAAAASTCRSTGACRPGSAAPCSTSCPRSPTGEPPPTPRSLQLTDNPKAVRAVGSACATNPLPVVVPCHRVVRSDGGMGRLPRWRRGQADPARARVSGMSEEQPFMACQAPGTRRRAAGHRGTAPAPDR